MTERTHHTKPARMPAVDKCFRRAIGQTLDGILSDTVREPTPDEFLKLLEEADRKGDRAERPGGTQARANR